MKRDDLILIIAGLKLMEWKHEAVCVSDVNKWMAQETSLAGNLLYEASGVVDALARTWPDAFETSIPEALKR